MQQRLRPRNISNELDVDGAKLNIKRRLSRALADILEMCESEGETYDPSADGFVFSDQQINESIRTRTRERRAAEAYDHRLESAAA